MVMSPNAGLYGTLCKAFCEAVGWIGDKIAGLEPTCQKIIEALMDGNQVSDIRFESKYFRHLYVWSGVWQTLGWSSIIYMAALSSVSQELHEAAQIDGASTWVKIKRITIPMLSSVMFFVTVMLFIDIFNMFNEVYIMTAGGPDYSTYTLSMYIYFYAFTEFNMGRAAVGSWVLFTLVAIVTVIQFKVKKRLVIE